FDTAGYAEAARNYAKALFPIDEITLSMQTVSFENWKTELGNFRSLSAPYTSRNISNPDVNIIHLTPENFVKFKKQGAKNIGMTVWETDALPLSWVGLCNTLDEIWVPTEW